VPFNSLGRSQTEGREEEGKKVAAFVPTAKLYDLATFREKVRKIFQTGICLLGVGS
jgi:hypothetical protein